MTIHIFLYSFVKEIIHLYKGYFLSFFEIEKKNKMRRITICFKVSERKSWYKENILSLQLIYNSQERNIILNKLFSGRALDFIINLKLFELYNELLYPEE